MVATASTEHSYWLAVALAFVAWNFHATKASAQPIGMLGRSTGNHAWLLANASTCVSYGFRLRNARNARNASDCVWMETGLKFTVLGEPCTVYMIPHSPSVGLQSMFVSIGNTVQYIAPASAQKYSFSLCLSSFNYLTCITILCVVCE